jgi:hypothetical protein
VTPSIPFEPSVIDAAWPRQRGQERLPVQASPAMAGTGILLGSLVAMARVSPCRLRVLGEACVSAHAEALTFQVGSHAHTAPDMGQRGPPGGDPPTAAFASKATSASNSFMFLDWASTGTSRSWVKARAFVGRPRRARRYLPVVVALLERREILQIRLDFGPPGSFGLVEGQRPRNAPRSAPAATS